MKKKIFIRASVLMLTLFISACDNFLDINTDPTRLKSAQINQVLVAAEASLAFYQGTDLFLYSSLFSQQAAGSGVSGSQTRFYDSYIVTNTDVNNAFTNYYAGTLADLDYVKKLGQSSSNPQYAGISKIMEAYTFQTLVDAWGDIPYKEALKGVANVQPKYDGSKEVYDSLFLLVDAGVALTKQANVRPITTDDLIYGGDMSKWEKFGNTLKLRLALHYAKDDNGAKLNALISSGVPFMAGNADNFQMAFENVTARQNPINQFELNRQDYYAPAQVLVNMMNTKADPRRVTYFTAFPAPTGVNSVGNLSAGPWVGTPSNATVTNPSSRIHSYLRGTVLSDGGQRTTNGAPTAAAVVYDGAAPSRMLLYAEYCFIRAEASFAYGASAAPLANAQAWYQSGITASMGNSNSTVANSVPAAAIATYLTANGTLTSLQQIIEEKFVANYGVVLEPWTDWRRTGFPVLAPSLAAVANGNNTIPRILVYPLGEQQTNSANLPVRASLIVNGVFWDK